jgi:hypothetical protein
MKGIVGTSVLAGETSRFPQTLPLVRLRGQSFPGGAWS